ncbi:MAG: MoxR family ATPase [Sphingobacteriales bacterium]|jgi:MoxR-like ATPase|nr:MoxR family ATPase [Sphingobacteriales bacterium]MBP9140202.1 MoxR family ATPase [Chitinophagales bacterium]MDA0197664.1 MoxR family ATPase [Bacteroidota bacterium]MBK6888977.1 MoxR family ATPase [Sphingobacteriales bacterium]MBK7528521.1 MoxR family ATPase [Sphingobacteriales bacterium]
MDGATHFENRINLTPLHEAANAIKAEIGKAIVGQHEFIELLLVALFANGHVLIEGVPGIAKTLTAKLLARTVNTQFSRIQFTPDLMPADVIGTSVYNFKTSDFEFKRGPIFANLVLIDEINRAPAKTQSALFEVMEERQITADGTRYELPPPFMVLATQNPIEQEGTYRLPEAQLDRFLFKIVVNYPNLDQEIEILQGAQAGKQTHFNTLIQPVLTVDNLLQYRNLVQQVHVEPLLMRYIASVVQQTRKHKDIFLGASPRASLALLNAGKALAALRNRDFVKPEDIQYLAAPVMNHRILLSPEKEMEGGTASQVINLLMQQTEVPR